MIHPVPYFNVDQPLVRNRWLREYNQLTMIALANAMQHSDNNIPLTITSEFAAAVWQYFKRLQVLIATELLLLDAPRPRLMASCSPMPTIRRMTP